MTSLSPRMPLIDAVKAAACLAIVLHHLAFYGPMSDVAYPLMPGLIDGLYHYGRMAVMAFLVVSGFLSAQALAPGGVSQVDQPLLAIKRRYLRLALPFLAALILAMASASLARVWLQSDTVPGSPTAPQLLAHALLSNELLDQEALSAGVWYIGIDFQVFIVLTTFLWASRWLALRWPEWKWSGAIGIGILTLASLFIFNRDDLWDETALYFFAYYGLGCLSYWLTGRTGGSRYLALLVLLVVAALMVDFRGRVVVAGVVMLMLGVARQGNWLERMTMPAAVSQLARISYSVFLVHFPLCLLVSAAVFHFFAQHLAANITGMLVAFAVSIVGGAIFYRWVESKALDPRVRKVILASFAVGGLIAVLARGG